MPSRLQISFSGGETSGRLTAWCLENLVQRYDEHVVVFANTGREREETLEFVDECDRRLGFKTVWVEAVVHHGERRSSTCRVVDFASASRRGEPFRDVVSKYGIPNAKFLHCTRELKTNPMRAYMAGLGWGRNYDTAIGIRSDEIDRMQPYLPQRLIYPFISEEPTTKPQVNAWWKKQDFRLRLRSYQGNCVDCHKKSLRKLLTIMEENPQAFDFPEEMERVYGSVGPEFKKNVAPGYRRVPYRGSMSVADLRAELERRGQDWNRAGDDAQVYDEDFDVGGSCGESCEPFIEGGVDE